MSFYISTIINTKIPLLNMDSNIKHCIVNASNGAGWYPLGTKRLKESLIYHGFNGDIITFDNFPNDEYNKQNPYNIKASAITEVLKRKYTHVLWLDCSVWAIRNPNEIFDVINEHGYYFWRSGYNAAQCCSDKCLEYFDISRDEAEKYQDCSTSMFGFNTDNELGKKFIERWLKAAKDNVFDGSRLHDNQSKDKRFLFHRQDQSAATIILNQLELKLTDPGIYSEYYSDNISKSVVFTMRGM
jgi:hypothetical protein